jgi:hypothetical protein
MAATLEGPGVNRPHRPGPGFIEGDGSLDPASGVGLRSVDLGERGAGEVVARGQGGQ